MKPAMALPERRAKKVLRIAALIDICLQRRVGGTRLNKTESFVCLHLFPNRKLLYFLFGANYKEMADVFIKYFIIP